MTETKKKSNYTLVGLSNARIYINESKCNGCGLCGELCPFGLPHAKSSGKFEISDSELCIECSACKRNCPMQAIVMQEQKGCGCLWDARVRLKNNNKSCCS